MKEKGGQFPGRGSLYGKKKVLLKEKGGRRAGMNSDDNKGKLVQTSKSRAEWPGPTGKNVVDELGATGVKPASCQNQ